MRLIAFQARLAFAFGAAVALLALMAVLSYRRASQEQADQEWVEHTHRVIEKLDRVLGDLTDQETGERGYLLTGDPSFLQPYEHGRSRIENDLAELRGLTADNAAQQQRLDELAPVVKARLLLLEARAPGSGSQRDRTVAGKQLMDRIRALLEAMRQAERRLLTGRLQSVAAASRKMEFVIGIGSVLALLLLCLAAFVVQSEIGKRTTTERELRSAEERYHLLFDSNPLPSWVYDTRSLALLDVNAKAIAHYGYSREEFLRLHITDLRPPEDVPAMLEAIANSPATAETSRPWRHRKKSGEIIEVAVHSYPLRFAGEQARLVVALDVTERNQAQVALDRQRSELAKSNAELVAANKELEAFSYSVSHDLRAPLRSIDGFSLAVLEDCGGRLDSRGTEHLRRIRVATQRMAQLIDDMLALARVARAELQIAPVDLSSMAETIAADLRQSQPGRTVELRVAKGLAARADPRLMRVALENLLGNAWKFTSNHPSARIEFGRCRRNGSPAFFVRDDGAGFDSAYAARLFGAFQRLHSISEFPGTGVGLATVQRIIRRHGGEVWAEGAVEQGATFYFTL
jgi:PAS domain S-box-containing protein